MSKKIAISQSNYIPWKGYFDLIHMVDEFILYDDMQYTRRDWRNRNKIKTPDGVQWLTIPVSVKGKFFQKISETEVSDTGWRQKHWKTVSHMYARAPYFDTYNEIFKELYLGSKEKMLSNINYAFLTTICRLLGIKTRITRSSDYVLIDGRIERLVDLCKQTGADEYVSGPSARNYIKPEAFKTAGIKLSYIDYHGYPVYKQQYPPFEHEVSILDLLFQTGPDAKKYMKSFS